MSQTPENLLQERLRNEPPSYEDLKNFMDGQERDPGWLRYANGIYSFPYTWWVGVIQVQMLTGMWGESHKAHAQIRQQHLSAALYRLWSDPHKWERVWYVWQFCRGYHKAYLAGRFHGGAFTTVAQTARAKLPLLKVKLPLTATNFTAASFGGCILAVVKGATSIEDIIFSSITGDTRSVPIMRRAEDYTLDRQSNEDSQVQGVLKNLEIVDEINDIDPSEAVPIEVFCAEYTSDAFCEGH